jgi:hypothetical protein
MSVASRLSRRHLMTSSTGLIALGLAGCGGGGDGNNKVQLRVLNLSNDVPSLDVYLDNAKKVSAAATGVLTSYIEIDEDSYDFALRREGSTLNLTSGERSVAKDTHYTLVVWGRETSLNFVTLSEEEDKDDVDAGKARIRIFNASTDVGALDAYLTSANADLQETTATQPGVSNGSLSGYRDMSAGGYRLRITGSADPLDLRLDVPEVTLTEKTFTTYIFTGTSSGVLVNGYSLLQQGALATMPTRQARVRVVASADNRGTVGVSWGSQVLSAALASPTVGPYSAVTAGTQTLSVRLNGQVVQSASRTLEVGVDYTVMVWGNGTVSLIADDNRLPNAATGRVKLRMVHGSRGTAALTLSIDYSVVGADVFEGQASAFSTVASNNSVRVDVSTAASTVYSETEVKLVAQGVYTVFVLGGRDTPTAVLRKDR